MLVSFSNSNRHYSIHKDLALHIVFVHLEAASSDCYQIHLDHNSLHSPSIKRRAGYLLVGPIWLDFDGYSSALPNVDSH